MHRPQRNPLGARATARLTNQSSARSESRVRRCTFVLLIGLDRYLKDRLAKLLSAFAAELLWIEFVDRGSDATQRMKDNDGIDAVIMDWDLPSTWGFETQ